MEKANKLKDNWHVLLLFLFTIVAAAISFYLGSNIKESKHNTGKYDKYKIKKEHVSDDSLGIYVYIDQRLILHTKNACTAVYTYHNSKVVRPELTTNVTRSQLDRICSQCVSEKQLLMLTAIIESNNVATDEETDWRDN